MRWIRINSKKIQKKKILSWNSVSAHFDFHATLGMLRIREQRISNPLKKTIYGEQKLRFFPVVHIP